jgi:hypothetical protein
MAIRCAFIITTCIVILQLSCSLVLSLSLLTQSSSLPPRSLVISTFTESIRSSQIKQDGYPSLSSRLDDRREDLSDDGDDSPRTNGLSQRLNVFASSIRKSLRSAWNRLKLSLADEVDLKGLTATKVVWSAAEMSVTDDDDTGDSLPTGMRWAVAHPKIDLSGTWKPIVTADFLKQYDEYLSSCGATFFFRQLCLKFCSMTRETITQIDDGRILELDGKTPAGSWKRLLVSSGADFSSSTFDVKYSEFFDPDKDLVQVEAWWEDQGRVHRSILRNKQTVDGGEFETLRYLSDCLCCHGNDSNGTATRVTALTLVTESTFRPKSTASSQFKQAHIRWEYSRVY